MYLKLNALVRGMGFSGMFGKLCFSLCLINMIFRTTLLRKQNN